MKRVKIYKIDGNLMLLSDKSCFDEDDKQESIVLKSFRSDIPTISSSCNDCRTHGSHECSFHKIGTTTLHHSLLTKRQEFKEFTSLRNSLKMRCRQSTLSLFIIFVIKFQNTKLFKLYFPLVSHSHMIYICVTYQLSNDLIC